MMENYVVIGKFISTFGVKGELVLEHHLGEEIDPLAIKVIFIEEKGGKFMPYFVSSANIKSDTELLISLEGIDAPEKGKMFLRKQIWLPENEVKIQASKNSPIALLGFKVYDQKNEIGRAHV